MASAATSAPALLIGGPTASGKSLLALLLARRHDGVVINADSMQVYRDLAIMTARPDEEEMAQAPHRLFGFLDAAQPCSVALWLEAARAEADAAAAQGRLPILVGGTGLYLAAFMEGISPMPDVPPAVRQEISVRLEQMGSACLHAELAQRDPPTAARLPPGDRQRIVRALEVVTATGTPLSAWQTLPRQGAWPGPVLRWAVYESAVPQGLEGSLAALGPLDGLCFASGRAAAAFAAHRAQGSARVAVIGPRTAVEAQAAGLSVHAIARKPSLGALADATAALFEAGPLDPVFSGQGPG